MYFYNVVHKYNILCIQYINAKKVKKKIRILPSLNLNEINEVDNLHIVIEINTKTFNSIFNLRITKKILISEINRKLKIFMHFFYRYFVTKRKKNDSEKCPFLDL